MPVFASFLPKIRRLSRNYSNFIYIFIKMKLGTPKCICLKWVFLPQWMGIQCQPYIFCLLFNKTRSTTAWPILKSNSTFWFNFFLSIMNNKKNNIKGPQKLKKRGATHRCNRATMSRVVPCVMWAPKHCVDNILPFEERGDSARMNNNFFYHLFPNT